MLLKNFSRAFLNTHLSKFSPKISQLPAQICKKSSSFLLINSFFFSSSFSENLQHEVSPSPTQTYTERALNPSEITKQLISQLPKTPLPTIMHQIALYAQKLLPFDYDYFVESLKWLSLHQNQLTTNELLMLFDLAIEYKIDNIFMQTHFETELYCRVYLMTKKELAQYDLDVKNQLDSTFQALQAGSKDHFNIVSEKFKSILGEQNEGEQNQDDKHAEKQENPENQKYPQESTPSHNLLHKAITKPTYNASDRKLKSKQLESSLLKRISHIFLNSNSKNIDLNNLLLEVTTIRLDEYTKKQEPSSRLQLEFSPEFLLTYTRLTINSLQLLMTEYQNAVEAETKSNPAKYTRRSVKKIYKLQSFYYFEVAKLIEEKKLLESATNDQLLKFIDIISGFPIKRRSFKKSIGDALIDETKKRQLPYDNLVKFFELSRFDNKLLEHFENRIKGIEKLPTPPQKSLTQSEQDQVKDNQEGQTLVPEVLEETQKYQEEKVFKMPQNMFKKITKKKSKHKNKKFTTQASQEIDLTQPQEEPSSKQPEVK